MRRRDLLTAASAFGTAGLAATAGCLVPPRREPTSTVEYRFANDAAEPYRVRLFVLAEPPSTYEATDGDGATRELPARPETYVPEQPMENVGRLRPVDEPAAERRYTLAPGDGVGGVVEDAPRGAVLVYVVEDPEGRPPLRHVGSGACDEGTNRAGVDLTIRPTGMTVGISCRN